jgi:hypothetical protein
VRVRATIASVDGGTLTAKARDGGEMRIKLADNAPVNEVVKAPLSGIKKGSYLAITASPQPDGTRRQWRSSSSHRACTRPKVSRIVPNSTITNATVASQAAGVDGQTLTVTYKDGEKKIIVPSSAEIVTYKKASVTDLKPGQKIFVFAAKKLPDGMLEAPNISFGDYGVWR